LLVNSDDFASIAEDLLSVLCVIDLAIDIQPNLGATPAQGVGFVSNTFIFMDEYVERIGIYSQRVLKQNPHPELLVSGTNNRLMSGYQWADLYCR